MTYVEILKRGGRQYYYLTKNVRVGQNKWKKTRIYMGEKRPTAAQIAKAAQEAEQNAPKVSPFSYLAIDDVEVLEDLKESYMQWLKRTPESLKKKLNEDFMIRFTYHSNAIEGNRLTLRETALILKDKVIPSGVRAQDYNEAINGREALDYLKKYKGELNTAFLEKINGILTKNTDVVYGGRIRFFDVKIEGSTHAPPPHAEVKKHLLNLFKWYSANKNKLHPFELATIIHHKLAWIHPFEDGNGRTARAIMNWLLMKKKYPMFFIPVEKRQKYYETLELADHNDDKQYVSNMLRLIIDQIKEYTKQETV